ncbi:Transmembrane secretion effector [Micromonospora matsumotoense]|uniref:Transmembrane secretion effector n=1 Tax=Micromonospora matsumotoense TaxID=121616 RepID=A0A1C4Z6H1_9ACTN|nr:MFS transporter [Micromonospora matsumotoense]SCF28565.1 Transmembrane secretion effector [Micromonospora matsumotoense]
MNVRTPADPTAVAEKPRLGREFGKFWTAAACSGVGDGISLAAAPLMASKLTDDPRLIAGVTMALTLPYVVFGIPAGVLVDRFDRRRSMAVIDFVRFGVMAAFTVTVLLGQTYLAVLYLCFFLVGTGETYFRNASQALVPSIVARDGLMHANGRLVATQSATTQFVGPLAGAALFTLTPVLPFGVDALTFLVSALLLSRLRLTVRQEFIDTAGAESGAARRLLADMTTGARWLWRHRLLRDLAMMAGALNFVSAGAMAVLVVYAHRSLGLSDLGYGLLLAAEAAGAVLAAPVAPVLVRRIGRDHALVIVAATHTAASLTLWLAPTWPMAVLAFFVAACGSVTWDVVVVALRQTLIPDGLQGRVNSVYRLVAWGAIPLGAAAAGMISHRFGPPAVYGFGAVLMVLIMLRMLVGARRQWITRALATEAAR